MILLPLSPSCWDYWLVAPCLLLCSDGNWTQGFLNSKKMLYQLTHTLSSPPSVSFYKAYHALRSASQGKNLTFPKVLECFYLMIQEKSVIDQFRILLERVHGKLKLQRPSSPAACLVSFTYLRLYRACTMSETWSAWWQKSNVNKKKNVLDHVWPEDTARSPVFPGLSLCLFIYRYYRFCIGCVFSLDLISRQLFLWNDHVTTGSPSQRLWQFLVIQRSSEGKRIFLYSCVENYREVYD